MKSLLLALILLPTIMIGQDRSLPVPECGWDSLKARISYPDLALRAGLRAAFLVDIEIDSLGTMTKLDFEPFQGQSTSGSSDNACLLRDTDSLFIFEAVIPALSGLKWRAGQIAGKPKSMKVELPLVFNLLYGQMDASEQGVMIIEVTRPRFPIYHEKIRRPENKK